MTVIESIIQFLSEYEQESRIGVDKLESQTVSYSLMKAPQENVQHFISGTEIHTAYYQLMAHMDVGSENERIGNHAWGQGISEWISGKSRAGEYPELDGYKCVDIGVSTPFYMGVMDGSSAVYQMTVFIKYERKNSL